MKKNKSRIVTSTSLKYQPTSNPLINMSNLCQTEPKIGLGVLNPDQACRQLEFLQAPTSFHGLSNKDL